MDRQLRKLRVEGPVYTTAFYRLVYNEDLASSGDKGHVNQIDRRVTFDLLSEEAICTSGGREISRRGNSSWQCIKHTLQPNDPFDPFFSSLLSFPLFLFFVFVIWLL